MYDPEIHDLCLWFECVLFTRKWKKNEGKNKNCWMKLHISSNDIQKLTEKKDVE